VNDLGNLLGHTHTCSTCASSLVVTKAGLGYLVCCAQLMLDTQTQVGSPQPELTRVPIKLDGTVLQLGKRYECTVCGTEVLCSRAGVSQTGTLCCDTALKVKMPRSMPSGD
jgi:hypothetical protein